MKTRSQMSDADRPVEATLGGQETLTSNQHFVLQILSLLLFSGFAIVATVLAFVSFWPAGVIITIILALKGFAPMGRMRGVAAVEKAVSKVLPESDVQRKTGNASFDAYRTDVVRRLEEEQIAFEGFLDRLRAAKDEREFDRFMDDRAVTARLVTSPADEPVSYPEPAFAAKAQA
jgi:hypothetical protein